MPASWERVRRHSEPAVSRPCRGPLWRAVLPASRRSEALLWHGVTAGFTVVALVSLAGAGVIDLSRDDGGVARSVALGVLFVIAGLLGTRYGSRAYGRGAP